ncbi:hypothetical protein PCANC_04939 [Puccinia coronata f. sp. avenae]|uniref:40S ribosomal protein S12 n=1 Tax=Puccinia coronata f. sp. avenae TaxID=200324 RepID=A0A2N5VWI9_9BASI|nr:hypothetical protein PCANC_14082 [Puccinia coronata f. sp. avenae]PLW24492.1 hypothetical protein PCASD_07452 [Puccinia coronata f. sp. avenae]PLW48652.1 hypothetical protein PCASD_03420 [Puccinia coronata f. sp. avenae]PLW54322.1 hypothetical protein PCANC_04939 [Puccinia coronata f. sp. avenae]
MTAHHRAPEWGDRDSQVRWTVDDPLRLTGWPAEAATQFEGRDRGTQSGDVWSTCVETTAGWTVSLLEEIITSNDMSDVEDAPIDVAEEEVEVTKEADAPKGGQMSVEDALKKVLKTALVHDGLARGLRESAKALDKRQAHLCVLNEGCTEEAYVKLIEALCSEHKINLIKVGDGKLLGEWCGLCKIDRDGTARKVVSCSCVVVKEFGQESEALNVLLDHFGSR